MPVRGAADRAGGISATLPPSRTTAFPASGSPASADPSEIDHRHRTRVPDQTAPLPQTLGCPIRARRRCARPPKKAACRLRSDSTLSESRNHWALGSLSSSRMSLRSVHTECSTHHQRWRMPAGCGAQVAPGNGRRSMTVVIRHRLHASTFLRPLAPRAFPRFSATPDALTASRRNGKLAACATTPMHRYVGLSQHHVPAG